MRDRIKYIYYYTEWNEWQVRSAIQTFQTNVIVFSDPETLYQFKGNKQQGSPLVTQLMGSTLSVFLFFFFFL